MIWIDLAFGSRYMGMNLHIIGLESRQKWIWASIQFLFFWLAHDFGPNIGGLAGPGGWVWVGHKKNLFIKQVRSVYEKTQFKLASLPFLINLHEKKSWLYTRHTVDETSTHNKCAEHGTWSDKRLCSILPHRQGHEQRGS